MKSRLPEALTRGLRLPMIAAPMFLVSGPDLVMAACRAGVIGAFPAPNARNLADLEDWLTRIEAALSDSGPAPWAMNMITHRTYERFDDELELVRRFRPPLIITALGSPRPVVEAVHGYGGHVFADVNTVSHARKALAAGADGLVLVCSGAGGHTGEYAAFGFVAEVRRFWDGPLVVAGAVGGGRAVRAAETLDADLAYVGTRFIAARESLASDDYRQMLVESTIEDILRSAAFTGVPANMLRPSVVAAGVDPGTLGEGRDAEFGGDLQSENKPWKNVWSAGHAVGAVQRIQEATAIVADLEREYAAAIEEQQASGDDWLRHPAGVEPVDATPSG